jgi:hypothetical protein
MKTGFKYLGIAYLAVAFLFSVSDAFRRDGLLNLDRSTDNLGDSYRNLLWPLRLLK